MYDFIPNGATDWFEKNPNVWPLETGAGVRWYPSEHSTRFWPMYDQNKDVLTRFACTVYWSTHTAHSTQNRDFIDPKEETKRAIAKWWLDPSRWWSLHDVVQHFHTNGLVKGYAKVEKTEYAIKEALFAWYSIVTGSRHIDWAATRRNWWYAVFGGASWHLFSVDWRKDGHVICRNSRSSLPEFYVKRKDLNKLYTLIAFTDTDTAKVTKEQQDSKDLQYAIDQGITNGEEMDKQATRRQAAVMLGRLTYKWLDDNQIVGKTRWWLWNGENGELMRQHAWIMVARWVLWDHAQWVPDYKLIEIMVKAWVTNWHDSWAWCTRRQLAIMIVRAYKAKKGLFI